MLITWYNVRPGLGVLGARVVERGYGKEGMVYVQAEWLVIEVRITELMRFWTLMDGKLDRADWAETYFVREKLLPWCRQEYQVGREPSWLVPGQGGFA